MKEIYFVINNAMNHKIVLENGGGASEWLFYLTAYKLNTNIIYTGTSNIIDNIKYINYHSINFNDINNSIIIIHRDFELLMKIHKQNSNNKYLLWSHDYIIPRTNNDINDYFKNNNISIIAGSEFHKKNILSVFPDINVIFIYNALFPEYFPKNPQIEYNNNQILFASSWNKGLQNVLKIAKEYFKINNNFRLILLRPSYCVGKSIDIEEYPFIIIKGNIQNKRQYCELIQQSLCVISTNFAETFGCVFAEALHLGVPVLGNNSIKSGFHEFIPKDHLVNFDNIDQVIIKIEEFRKNRPIVKLDDAFYEKSILDNWYNLFASL
jgi:hypothetical protein